MGTEDGGSSFGDMASVGDYNMDMASIDDDSQSGKHAVNSQRNKRTIDNDEEVGQSVGENGDDL